VELVINQDLSRFSRRHSNVATTYRYIKDDAVAAMKFENLCATSVQPEPRLLRSIIQQGFEFVACKFLY